MPRRRHDRNVLQFLPTGLGGTTALVEVWLGIGVPIRIAIIVVIRLRSAERICEQVRETSREEQEKEDIWASCNPEIDGKQNPRAVQWGRRRLPARNQVSRRQ